MVIHNIARLSTMHAYLITGGTAKLRETTIEEYLTKWKTAQVDQVMLGEEEERVGIDAVRLFQQRLSLAPMQSPQSVGIIRRADRLTQEAQNALLKLLEEPPKHVFVLCEAPSTASLLPTIVSRCELVNCRSSDRAPAIPEMNTALKQLLAGSNGQKLIYIETIAKDRLQAKEWTAQAIEAATQLLASAALDAKGNEKRKTLTKLLRLLLGAQKELELNVNPKLVLDTVFLSIHPPYDVFPEK